MHWIQKQNIPSGEEATYEGIPLVVAQVLYNRGLRDIQGMKNFLSPSYTDHIHDPFLFRDMEAAVERVQRAIREKEKIIAHGDYDADGVCGAAVLVEGLRTLGADVSPYIPHREREGYGLNKESVEGFAKSGVKLLITADCGISNKPEIELAKNLGMDVIVTDHHQQPPELPPADAIINPNVQGEPYPFRGLAGVGVAFKLISALYQRTPSIKPGMEKWLLDLVAISTITDMMPLLDENRVLVRYGLVVMRKTRRTGLLALLGSLKNGKESVDAQHIGFHIGPRLNAAGRLKHANIAYDLLTSTDVDEADKLLKRLEQVNEDRKFITELIGGEVDAQLGTVTEEQKALFAFGKNWPIGVVGLVANKVAQKYNRPVFILGESDGNIVASGRSVPQVNIVEILQASKQYYLKYGGHAAACGFTLKHKEDLEEWKIFIHELISEKLKDAPSEPILNIESEIRLEDTNWEMWKFLSELEPYGQANPRPIFSTKNALVRNAKTIGKDGKHLKLVIAQGNHTREAVGFGFGKEYGGVIPGKPIDIAYEVDANEWNGEKRLQLKIKDIKI